VSPQKQIADASSQICDEPVLVEPVEDLQSVRIDGFAGNGMLLAERIREWLAGPYSLSSNDSEGFVKETIERGLRHQRGFFMGFFFLAMLL